MISFCIITDGKEPEKLQNLLNSIEAIRGLGKHEVVIAGNLPPIEGIQRFTYVPMPGSAKQGRLGALRNGACLASNGEMLVVCDDDMEFLPNWNDGFLKQPHDLEFDLCSCRILNPDGSRYWDWKCHENGMNWLLDYNKVDPRISLTGGLTIMMRYVFDNVKWDDSLGFNMAEDVDFTNRVKMAGYTIKFNEHSTVVHHGPYTQQGLGVVRVRGE